MACNDNYIWDGSAYSSVEDPDCYILHLGGGRTICDIIESNGTRVPDHIMLYSGDDPDVPANIRCTDRDLVIHCNDTATIQSVSVCYFDALTRVWRGPYLPETSFTDATKTWFVYRNYLDTVIPYKSEVRMQLSGELAPINPPKDDTSNAATAIQLIQPPEEFNLALEMSIYNDAAMTDLNAQINTVTPNPEFPVGVYNGSSFVQFPVDGVDKTTAGQYVVVSLKNLEYTDIVYIKWIWRGIASGVVAGSGASIYPAYTATNPDNIGFVWETTM